MVGIVNDQRILWQLHLIVDGLQSKHTAAHYQPRLVSKLWRHILIIEVHFNLQQQYTDTEVNITHSFLVCTSTHYMDFLQKKMCC